MHSAFPIQKYRVQYILWLAIMSSKHSSHMCRETGPTTAAMCTLRPTINGNNLRHTTRLECKHMSRNTESECDLHAAAQHTASMPCSTGNVNANYVKYVSLMMRKMLYVKKRVSAKSPCICCTTLTDKSLSPTVLHGPLQTSQLSTRL